MKKTNIVLLALAAIICFAGCRSKLTRDNLVSLPVYNEEKDRAYDCSAICLVKKLKLVPEQDQERLMATGIFGPFLTPHQNPFAVPQTQAVFNDHQHSAPELLQKLFEAALTKQGYGLQPTNINATANDLLKVNRVIEPVFVLQRSARLRDEYASDLLILVEVRQPPSAHHDSSSGKCSRVFQAWSRSFIRRPPKNINSIFVENCTQAIDHLFNNPEFRKALEPGGMSVLPKQISHE